MKRGILILFLMTTPVFADDVHLRGGGRISGQIVEETEESVSVDIGGGIVSARKSSVVKIDRNVSPLQAYRDRASKIPDGDVEAWRELARWAQGMTLSSQVAEAYGKIVAVVPNDPEANEALGRVLLDGVWVSEEESFTARGFVSFEGEWMTPGERQQILAERQAREAENRQVIAEAAERDNQYWADLEAKKQAEHDAFWASSLPQVGDPVLVGWGYAPTYWPAAGAPDATVPVTPPAGKRP